MLIPTMAPAPARYGALSPRDHNGVCLPDGFSSRVVARSGQRIGGIVWHPAPGGGACFADGAGWIYVSNSEIPLAGGAAALRFDAGGNLTSAYPVLVCTNLNRAGCVTGWDTWLSCEGILRGYVWEVDPRATRAARPHPAMGRFAHVDAACDPLRQVVYLTEDEPDGCFYRYRPDLWADLSIGRLEVLCHNDSGVDWLPVPEPAPGILERATRHQVPSAVHVGRGAECRYEAGACHFTTSDGVCWAYDADHNVLRSTIDGAETFRVTDFLRLEGHEDSVITGAAFSPDGSRLYFSSQRGTRGTADGGITFEVTGPFV
ncbi:MAG TPA: alkaline phosphatase PhoX [Stackebrandtia sp.]|uniref:alkaline phosphatase PhoX n=1 Tax=Stackebrandtia sp. TaxID=2023065 RepID=UPI002D27823F|nr:alkaline phosphatase PhoX [Stackebrandtia sp.]HZE39117.1 alkaline phosphatase PhoX [Stackebrandtia sp.]